MAASVPASEVENEQAVVDVLETTKTYEPPLRKFEKLIAPLAQSQLVITALATEKSTDAVVMVPGAEEIVVARISPAFQVPVVTVPKVVMLVDPAAGAREVSVG